MSMEQPEALATGSHQALLGRLHWRAGMDETFATDALNVLLESAVLRRALLSHFAGRFAAQQWTVDLDSVIRCETQVVDKVFGRPDMVFRDTQGSPVLVLEAKLLDELKPDQVKRYLRWQATEAPGRAQAAVLLVANHRMGVATEAGHEAAEELGVSKEAIVVVSWTEVLSTLATAAAQLGTAFRSYSADVAQLHDLVHARTGSTPLPLAGSLDAENWDANLDALNELVTVVGKRVNERRGTAWTQPQLSPVGSDGFGPSHYVCEAESIHYSLGPQKAFASQGTTPLWIRIHKTTANKRSPVVEALRSRLISDGRWQLRNDWGHVWVPVQVELPWDESLADRVVAEVLAILEVAIPSSADVPGTQDLPS